MSIYTPYHSLILIVMTIFYQGKKSLHFGVGSIFLLFNIYVLNFWKPKYSIPFPSFPFMNRPCFFGFVIWFLNYLFVATSVYDSLQLLQCFLWRFLLLRVIASSILWFSCLLHLLLRHLFPVDYGLDLLPMLVPFPLW